MKVVNIRISDDWKGIDIENDNIDVCVDTEDGYTYTLNFTTPKNLQFLMEKEKMDYYGPDYPFIVVNKLTPEIIEQAVKAFAEEAEGYWLKVYHFGGPNGIIGENLFDQLKAKHIKEEREFNKLDLVREVKNTLKSPGNERNFIYVIKQYRSGNKHPGIRTRAVPWTCLHELRVKSGARIYVQEKNDKIKVAAISGKGNQEQVIRTLTDLYPKENNV
jgi:hypothetical protein